MTPVELLGVGMRAPAMVTQARKFHSLRTISL
jgi:hypothetical protein